MGDDSRIWVGGLPERVSEDDIKEEYNRFGPIKGVQIRYNTGRCSFAFVQYSNRRDAEDAVKATDQSKLFGMPFIKVAWAGQRSSGKGGGKGGRSRSRRRSPSRRRSRSNSRRRSPSRRRSRSRRRSESKRRSPSRRRSPSKKRSPSPRRRTPSPRRRSDSPRRRSPSPRQRSRSREQSRPRSPPQEKSNGNRSRSPPRNRSPDQRRKPPPSELQGKYRIIVENLPKDMDWQELKDLGATFAKHGKCTFARTRPDRTGELEYTALEDMEKALKELDKRRFSGSDERLKAYEQRR
mmetsp:Transcript_94813/g.149978  ORF Transcript_94813/g.149978 Transcript_94813/m.149978 type:complete len:294 (+) Transcript_94813:22-903(+)